MSAALAERVRRIRSRALLRARDYRLRHHAHGVWYRLRRELALARSAYAISEQDARTLSDEGLTPLGVGLELEPSKSIFVIPRERFARLGSAVELPLRLGPELLAARRIVLIPFEPARSGP